MHSYSFEKNNGGYDIYDLIIFRELRFRWNTMTRSYDNTVLLSLYFEPASQFIAIFGSKWERSDVAR